MSLRLSADWNPDIIDLRDTAEGFSATYSNHVFVQQSCHVGLQVRLVIETTQNMIEADNLEFCSYQKDFFDDSG